MRGIETSEEAAIRAEQEARDVREYQRRQTLPMEERIHLWREDSGGEELEDVVELLCGAEAEIRRLKGLPPEE